jgi:hypothetical protein
MAFDDLTDKNAFLDVSFGVIPFHSSTDILATAINVVYDNKNISVVGLPRNSDYQKNNHVKKLFSSQDENLPFIRAIANRTLINKYRFRPNQIITFQYKQPILQLKSHAS